MCADVWALNSHPPLMLEHSQSPQSKTLKLCLLFAASLKCVHHLIGEEAQVVALLHCAVRHELASQRCAQCAMRVCESSRCSRVSCERDGTQERGSGASLSGGKDSGPAW